MTDALTRPGDLRPEALTGSDAVRPGVRVPIPLDLQTGPSGPTSAVIVPWPRPRTVDAEAQRTADMDPLGGTTVATNGRAMSDSLAVLDEVVDRMFSAGLLLRAGLASSHGRRGVSSAVAEQAIAELDSALADLRDAVSGGAIRRRRF